MSESRFPWRTLLFLSLALNLLVIGVAAGAYGAGVRVQREGAAIVDRMPGPRAFMAALPPATRAKMRQELVQSWDQSREARRAAVQARRDAFTAAATEPYDVERVRAAFARLRVADQDAIAVFHDNVVEAFSTLSPQERREALEALRRSAPATRRTVAPRDGEEAAPDDAELTPRERFREKLRERRRARQQQP